MLNGVFMLLAFPFSVYYNEYEKWGILEAGITTIAIGFILWFFNRNATKNLGKKEGYFIPSIIQNRNRLWIHFVEIVIFLNPVCNYF